MSMKMMVRIHGFWAECLEMDEGPVKMMSAYRVNGDGRWYLAIGNPEIHSEDGTLPGIYVYDDGQIGYVPWPDGEEGPCPVSREPLSREEQIVNKAARWSILGLLAPEAPEEKGPPQWNCPAPVSSSLLGDAPVPGEVREEIISFEKHEDDSQMVAYVKECVNLARISRSEFYSHFPSQREGYNLIYGLRQRRTMTWAYVEKWAEILGLEVRVTFVSPKEKQDEQR